MSTITKDLGVVTAYGYAVTQGYTGTEEEFAELMASYASVAEQAAQSAETAEEAAQAAAQAVLDANAAKTAAQTAQGAAESAASSASNSATSAASSASTASTAATAATEKAREAAASATAAAGSATAAETAQEAAEDAQAAAEAAVSSLSDFAPAVKNTASGDIASFTDGADDYPVKDLVAHIEPVQSGSGDPSPDNVRPITGWTGANVTRTGKNLLDASDIADYSKWSTDIAPSGNMPSEYSNKMYLLPRLKGGLQYTISFGITPTSFPTYLYFGYCKDGTGTRVSYITTDSVNNQNFTFTAVDGVTYCLRMGSTDTAVIFNNQIAKLTYIQLELGSTATSYEPYQGDTYSVTFPTEAGTVYGGTLDVTTGVLTVDKANIASYNGETLTGEWISDRDVYSVGSTPSIGAQVVYKLATPITYQCTPTEVKTLLGANNIFADTGDVNAEYCADTKKYIDNAIAAAVASLS